MDHYSTLQISRDAEPEVIEKAYRALCLKYHPDTVDEARRAEYTKKMQRINEAYRVVRDPAERRRYDSTLRRTPSGRSAWDEFMDKGLVGMLFDKMGAKLTRT